MPHYGAAAANAHKVVTLWVNGIGNQYSVNWARNRNGSYP